MINALWLILIVPCFASIAFVAGAAWCAVHAIHDIDPFDEIPRNRVAASQPHTPLNSAEQHSRTQQSQGPLGPVHGQPATAERK